MHYLWPDFGYPITTPNVLHFELKFLLWRLSEDVRTGVVKGFEQLFTIKNRNTQLNKKSPLRIEPIMDIMDQKNDRTVFQVDIMSVHPPQIWHQTSLNHAQKTSPSEASEVLWEVAHC